MGDHLLPLIGGRVVYFLRVNVTETRNIVHCLEVAGSFHWFTIKALLEPKWCRQVRKERSRTDVRSWDAAH